jgi:hypothetical protein
VSFVEIRRLLVVTVAVLAVLGSVPTPALAGDTAGAGSTDATVAIVGGVAPAVASAAVLAADASPENATAPAGSEQADGDDTNPPGGNERQSPAAHETDGDSGPVRVYVLLVDADPAHEAALEALGAEVILRSGEHVSAWATPAVVERLRAAPFVVRVGPLPELRPPPQPTPPGGDFTGDGDAYAAVDAVRTGDPGPDPDPDPDEPDPSTYQLVHVDSDEGTLVVDVIEVTFRRASVGDPAALHYLVRTIDFENPRGPTFDEVPDLGSSPPSLGWSFADGPITPPDGPVIIGVPSEGAWEVVGTDPDDPIRLDYAALAAQTDGENLFVRLDYNGDYSAASPVRNELYLDTDGDATTGRTLSGGFGADYSITTFPGVPGAAVERWDPAAADFVSVGRVTYIQSEFAREQQVVGAALSDLRLAEGDAVSFLARLHVPSGAIADQLPDGGRATFVIGGASPPADGDDRFEPNDRPGQERPLAPGTYADLRVAGADIDRFALLAPGGTRVGVADSTTDDHRRRPRPRASSFTATSSPPPPRRPGPRPGPDPVPGPTPVAPSAPGRSPLSPATAPSTAPQSVSTLEADRRA